MQKCEKKSDAEAWNKVFYESNVNTLILKIFRVEESSWNQKQSCL